MDRSPNCCRFLRKEDLTCQLLKMECAPLEKKAKQKCGLSFHYKWLIVQSQDPPIAKLTKKEVGDGSKKAWKKHFLDGAKSGRKDMTARSLEDGIYRAVKDALKEDCEICQRKRKTIGNTNIRIVADCLVEKKDKPTCIISIKTGLTPEAIRETFAYAYMFKECYGQQHYRVYIVALGRDSQHEGDLDELGDALKSKLDGVYYLSQSPYFDDLLRVMKEAYD